MQAKEYWENLNPSNTASLQLRVGIVSQVCRAIATKSWINGGIE